MGALNNQTQDKKKAKRMGTNKEGIEKKSKLKMLKHKAASRFKFYMVSILWL